MTDPEMSSHVVKASGMSDDELQLAALGKKQVMKRNFNVWSLIFMSFCTSVTWEALCSTMAQALTAGGSSSMVFGFLAAAIGALLIALSIGEFASIVPTSGGQYHYVAELAPPKYRRILSFYAAWVTVYGWVLSTASGNFALAMQVQAYIILFVPDYVYQRWHTSLILIGMTTFFAIVGIFGIKILPRLNWFGMFLHIAGFFATVIYLLVKVHPKNTAKFVFTDQTNLTGWDSSAIAWNLGLLSSAIGFVGWDSASHMAEEMQHAARDLPKTMIGCVALTGLLTFPWVIVLMFCMTDIVGVLTGPVGLISPLVQLMYNVSGGEASATVGMTLFFLLLSFFVAGPNSMTATSRIIWSFAREGGLPKPLAKIGKKQVVPVNALIFTWLLVCLLSLIYIGNSTAFYGIASGVTVTLIFSYAFPIFLNVFWGIQYNRLRPGPFTLGRWSRPINVAALVWCTYLIIFLCFPSVQPVTKVNMNYASLVFGFGLILPTIAWFTYGSRSYLGIPEVLDADVAEAIAVIMRDTKIA